MSICLKHKREANRVPKANIEALGSSGAAIMPGIIYSKVLHYPNHCNCSTVSFRRSYIIISY